MFGLLKTTPDGQKALALRASASEHYALATGGGVKNDSIRLTLMYTAVGQYCLATLAADGYRIDTSKPGGHLAVIGYIRSKKVLNEEELSILDEMRAVRNKVNYSGMEVANDYLGRKIRVIASLASKLAKA